MLENDPHFDMLKQKILYESGLDVGKYKDSYLRRRFRIRTRAKGAASLYSYIKILDQDPLEYPRLMDTLDVNVTEFFRNPEAFDYLKDEIIPNIIAMKKARGKNSIRVWSAGCSDGKEGYSLSMLFHEALGHRIEDYQVRIKCTDIDPTALRIALGGVYESIPPIDLRAQIKPQYLIKYFHIDGTRLSLKSMVKDLVHFEQHDLFSGKKYNGFDLILCRNVTIYFSRELQEELYMNFYRALNSGGFFVMGKTEMLVGAARDRFKAVSNRERIYQKLETNDN